MTSPPLRVGDVMRPQFVAVDGMETVKGALEKLHESRSTVLIVDRRHDDDEYGIVLLTDIVSRVLAPDRAVERVNVYEIMSKPVISVPEKMLVKNCARLFTSMGISTAPVLRDDQVVGIVGYWELAFGGM